MFFILKKFRGFCHIKFAEISSVNDALSKNGHKIQGRPIKVDVAQDKRAGGGDRGGRGGFRGGRDGGFDRRGGGGFRGGDRRGGGRDFGGRSDSYGGGRREDFKRY